MNFEIKPNEACHILDSLYFMYLENLEITGAIGWASDSKQQVQELKIGQLLKSEKTKLYIGGGYEAKLTFDIVLLLKNEQAPTVFDEKLALNTLGVLFDNEKNMGFKNVELDVNITDLAMATIPVKKELENEIAEYTANYTLMYKVKGRF